VVILSDVHTIGPKGDKCRIQIHGHYSKTH